MSSGSRRELLERTVDRYRSSDWEQKRQILTEFVEATGYSRKHAIRLLGKGGVKTIADAGQAPRRGRPSLYTAEVVSVVRLLWETSCRLCGKRLVPFLPELVVALERHGHLSITEDTRTQVLSISAATVDRLLAADRHRLTSGLSTTHPGGLLRKQIAVRTHFGWEERRPGYFEADTVAHCGDRTSGPYLFTLVVTDIATGWTDFEPVLDKTAASIQTAVDAVRRRLPFGLLGLDTDNGSEFINELLYGYCQNQQIAFTRSRAYRKNDQAHVEQKNGSVVRRLIGYDRYEGRASCAALSEVYGVLRLFQNYFQPSMQLVAKQRDDGRVTKRYDAAQTPYQRLRQGDVLAPEALAAQQALYEGMDPLGLRGQLQERLDQLWRYAWVRAVPQPSLPGAALAAGSGAQQVEPSEQTGSGCTTAEAVVTDEGASDLLVLYRKTRKPRAAPLPHEQIDFTDVWETVERSLRANPRGSAQKIYRTLQSKHPDRFPPSQLRTFYRRLSRWRRENQRPKPSCPAKESNAQTGQNPGLQ